MPQFQDVAPPATRPSSAGTSSLDATFLKSVFAELTGRPAGQRDGRDAGERAATAARGALTGQPVSK